MTRTWRMFAGRAKHVEGRFLRCGDERTVRLCGLEPVEVELVEDPGGDYWGWISRNGGKTGALPETGVPTMVQPHEGVFRMQSPDGFKQDVERGYGEIVRMTCRAVDDSA